MNKKDAIKLIKKIQNGKFDRNEIADIPKGELAKKYWNDALFAFGMEYGAILIIMKIFDITKKDLNI